ncbi:site-specific integrase, partial [Mariniblastus sp.]|nr:site-specific integrase [Mariniblastus sp.]
MRGPSKTPPKYRKHKASGQAIVSIDGKDFYLGPHGTHASRIEYDRRIGEWLANGRQLPSCSKSITIVELVAQKWKHAKGYYVKNGEPTDELPGLKIALQVLKNSYGETTVDNLGPIAIAALQGKFIARGNCRKYVNQNIGRIKRCIKWGVSQELVPVDVYQRIATVNGLRKGKTKAPDRNPILPVEQCVVEATIKAISNPIVKDIIRIQSLSCCRPGETVAIRPCDIDKDT